MNIAKSALYSFSKYVPKLLVDQLLRMGNIAAPGGEKRTITILFSDIIGFTNIAEQMEANDLMQQLSEYLDALTKCIHANHGNIDKYMVTPSWHFGVHHMMMPVRYSMPVKRCWIVRVKRIV